jgi:hypothetical protein
LPQPKRVSISYATNETARFASDKKLNPYFVTGFADGESCFMINVSKDSKNNTGYLVKVTFQIYLHSRDLPLLEEIQNFFNGVGNITL